MVALTVRDAAGNIVKPDHYPCTRGFPSMPVGIPLAGGASRPIRSFDRLDWVRLADWGYGSLPPGHYTLSGVLRALVTRSTGEDQNTTVVERFFTSDQNGKGAIASASFDVAP